MNAPAIIIPGSTLPAFADLPKPKEFDATAMVEKAMRNISNANISTIVSSYQSVILNVHSWTAEIKSRKASEDAARANNANADIIKTRVSILNDNPALKDVNNYAQKIRAANKDMTGPSVDGERILKNNRLQEHINVIGEHDRVYRGKGYEFAYNVYPGLIADGQKALGDLARTVVYPTPDEVYSKFYLTVRRQPLAAECNPHAAIEAQARAELEQMFVDSLKYTITNAMTDSWWKLYEIIYNMVNSLTDKVDDTTGQTKKKSLFSSTLIEHPKKYIETLDQYNIAKDPALEARAMELRRVLSKMDMGDLKEFPDARRAASAELQDILSKFEM